MNIGVRLGRTAAILVCALTLVGPAVAVDSVYTPADVALHAVETDCWTIVRGAVYNLSAWIAQHPHGSADIVAMCGRDATGDYETEHNSTEAAKTALATFRIGYLADAMPTPAPSQTAVAKPAVKKPSVSCVKGKQVKRFATKKCPSGWKRK